MGLRSKILNSRIAQGIGALAWTGAAFVPTYEMLNLNPPAIYAQEQSQKTKQLVQQPSNLPEQPSASSLTI